MKKKNWKTTLFGAVAVLPQMLLLLIPTLPIQIFDLVTAIAAAAAFYFAKDKDDVSKS